jgi:uncharacterized protein with GYD domain
MAAYVTLYKFTGPIKGGGPERFKKFNALVEQEGGKMLTFYGLQGAYDVITICDYPSTRAAVKAAAAIGNLISAQTHTMAAIDRDDFLQLLTEL